jgi:hypothetical protein
MAEGVRPVCRNKRSLIVEQAAALPGGQLLHNVERFQMARRLVDCRRDDNGRPINQFG